jgi:glycosyltransferase involved in cell wall biosynthesis
VNYVEDMKSGILLRENGNHLELIDKIQFLIENDTLKESFAKAFSKSMKANHSRSEYVKKIVSILQSHKYEMS